jgi:PBSX family phage portal protein
MSTDFTLIDGPPGDGKEVDDEFVIEKVMLGEDLSRELVSNVEPDPFEKPVEELRTFKGISPTVKKRMSRIEKAHTGTGGARSKKIETEGVSGYNLFGVVTPPYNLDYLAKLYVASPAHYAACNVKAANIVGLGFDFVDSHKAKQVAEEASANKAKTKKIQNRLKEARNLIFEWLDGCNDEDEFDETLKNWYLDYEATGNGYLEIGRGDGGQIGYIGHIPSKTMRVREKRDGYVQIVGDKVRFFKHFGKDTPNPIAQDSDPIPNEVIHIKKYSPENSYYGVPDIIAAMQAVTGNEFAARYNLDYFENKAVPRYVIVVKGGKLGSQGHKSLMQFMEGSVKGKNHRTIIVPLPADSLDGKGASFEMQPIEAGVQDSSFDNYNKINLRDILMAHKTPMTKVTVADGVNLAVARDADKTFKEQVCRPEQRILEKKLGKIFEEKTDLLRFKLEELTLTDEDTQSAIDERYLRMQVVVPNEVRARWGKPPIEGGDEVVDLKAQTDPAAEAASTGNRTRDANRSANATDSKGEGRNTKGDGRKQA